MNVSTRVPSDLENYISQAYDQIMYDECTPCLNAKFWSEYKEIRRRISCELSSETLTPREFNTQLRVQIVNTLHSLGWKAFVNNDGCVEFYN